MNREQPAYLSHLRQLMDGCFGLQEIRDLFFDLGIDPEHLPCPAAGVGQTARPVAN